MFQRLSDSWNELPSWWTYFYIEVKHCFKSQNTFSQNEKFHICGSMVFKITFSNYTWHSGNIYSSKLITTPWTNSAEYSTLNANWSFQLFLTPYILIIYPWVIVLSKLIWWLLSACKHREHVLSITFFRLSVSWDYNSMRCFTLNLQLN